MKPFGMFRLPMILVGLGAAMLSLPSCKAQEVTNDHFTDSGVQNIYESAPTKQSASKQKPAPSQAGARKSAKTPATLQVVAQPFTALSSQEVADKRKVAKKKQ